MATVILLEFRIIVLLTGNENPVLATTRTPAIDFLAGSAILELI